MLIQSMNVSRSNSVRDGAFVLCTFANIGTDSVHHLAELLCGNQALLIDGHRKQILAVSWSELDWRERKSLLVTICDALRDAPDRAQAVITWAFSGLRKPIAEIVEAGGTGDLSVADIVALDIDATDASGRRGATTRGLRAIIGHELEAHYADGDPRSVAKTVWRLASRQFDDGPEMASVVEGVDGRLFDTRIEPVGAFSDGAVLALDIRPIAPNRT